MSTVVTRFTPEAYNTLRKYMSTLPDPKNEVGLQVRAQKFTDAGMTIARRTLESKDESRGRQAILGEASKIFSMGKETNFYKACTDEYIELLKDQEILRTKYSAAEVAPDTSSVVSTMYSILRYAGKNESREQQRLLNDADNVAKKFRLPEKMIWHTKVKAFSETGQWKNLQALTDSRSKPPIGFKPFARATIKGTRPSNEILRFIERVTVPEERFSLYCEASLWTRALDKAVKVKDEQRIIDVRARCKDPEIQQAANSMLGRLA